MICRKAQRFSGLCMQCDIYNNIKCGLEFDFDKPEKWIRVERADCMNISWNECPTCGESIGFRPKEENFRCPKCSQRIKW